MLKFAKFSGASSPWINRSPVLGFIFIGLPYINLHAFGNLIVPSFFGRLGEEWLPKGLTSVKKGSIAITFVEYLGLFILDMIILSIIFSVAGIVYFMIIDLYDGWIGFFVKTYLKIKGVGGR